MVKFLAFDLEIARVQPPHVRDWKRKRPLGISCAATFCGEGTSPLLWYGGKRLKTPAPQMTNAEACALVRYLSQKVNRGFTIATWNGVGFDFDVLAEESGLYEQCKSLTLGHVDMMFHVLCELGFGVSLNAAARGMRLTKSCKKREGAAIPHLWARGKYDQVFSHVVRHVRLTSELATTCPQCGYIRWITRWGTGRMLRLPSGWRIASAAQHLPEPSPSCDSKRWSRERLTAWMRSSVG
jgi:hypothetical protein